MYISQLLRNYRGNRAPVGLYLHAAGMVGSQALADQYSAFFQYALTLPDVWVVTVSEVRRAGGLGWAGPGWLGRAGAGRVTQAARPPCQHAGR